MPKAGAKKNFSHCWLQISLKQVMSLQNEHKKTLGSMGSSQQIF